MTGTPFPAPVRGRVLHSLYHAPHRRSDRRPQGGALLTVLLLILPLFCETFQYVIDIAPLYALSKVWPLLTLPLAVIGVGRLDVPAKPLLLAAYAWVFGATPFLSIVVLGNTLAGAVTTTVKVWSLLTVFSLAAALQSLAPTTSPEPSPGR